MSRLLLAAALTLAASTAPLAAQTRPPVREQFVDMGEYVVNGSVAIPRIGLTHGRKAAEFGRLMNLKKDLVPGIFAARQDPTFK